MLAQGVIYDTLWPTYAYIIKSNRPPGVGVDLLHSTSRGICYLLYTKSYLTATKMATKQVFSAHAIKALEEQAKRFDIMSVRLPPSVKLATSHATEIATWASKLISLIRQIENEVTTSQDNLQQRRRELKSSADLLKRKKNKRHISRVKASFRLTFGPIDSDGKERRLRMKIKTIRGLCETNPHGVITLLTAYPVKVWSECSLDTFHGIIQQVKSEGEQDWPDELFKILEELETEGQMSEEFKRLQSMIKSHFCIVADQRAANIMQPPRGGRAIQEAIKSPLVQSESFTRRDLCMLTDMYCIRS